MSIFYYLESPEDKKKICTLLAPDLKKYVYWAHRHPNAKYKSLIGALKDKARGIERKVFESWYFKTLQKFFVEKE